MYSTGHQCQAMRTVACELNINALCPENNHGMAAQLITWVGVITSKCIFDKEPSMWETFLVGGLLCYLTNLQMI